MAAAASVNFSGKIPLVTTTIHYGNTPCFSLALLELTKKNLETKKISRDYLYSDSYFMYNSAREPTYLNNMPQKFQSKSIFGFAIGMNNINIIREQR